MYENVYQTVDVTGNSEVIAAATAKVEVWYTHTSVYVHTCISAQNNDRPVGRGRPILDLGRQ